MALVHGKRHDNVIQMIRTRVKDAGESGLLNFQESTYINVKGKTQPMITMTKDGYAFIVGKLAGKKAVDSSLLRLRGVTVR